MEKTPYQHEIEAEMATARMRANEKRDGRISELELKVAALEKAVEILLGRISQTTKPVKMGGMEATK